MLFSIPTRFRHELYYERPKKLWPRNTDGGLVMCTRPLDLKDLLSEAPDLHLSLGPCGL